MADTNKSYGRDYMPIFTISIVAIVAIVVVYVLSLSTSGANIVVPAQASPNNANIVGAMYEDDGECKADATYCALLLRNVKTLSDHLDAYWAEKAAGSGAEVETSDSQDLAAHYLRMYSLLDHFESKGCYCLSQYQLEKN